MHDGRSRAVRIRINRCDDRLTGLVLISCEDVTHVLEAQELTSDVAARVARAQNEERERLAQELHDSVGQDLVCVGLGLSWIRMVARDGEMAAKVEDTVQALRRVQAQVRTVSYLLHPPWSEHEGTAEDAVREFVQGFGRRAGLEVTVKVTGPGCRLDRARQLTLLRILQEALVNVHRHAHARKVTVELATTRDQVTMQVSDDGEGLPERGGEDPIPGVGIVSMRARVRHFGGQFAIASTNAGTQLRVLLPFETRPTREHRPAPV
jgi:signal transduction histidine kinase